MDSIIVLRFENKDPQGRIFTFIPGDRIGIPGRVKVVLDRRATLTPPLFESWVCRVVGSTRDRKVVFVLPEESVKARDERARQERIRQWEAEQQARAAAAEARQREELRALPADFVSEVEAIIKGIEAGPTRPAPTPPKEAPPPAPMISLGVHQGVVFTYYPGESFPIVLELPDRSRPVRGALSVDASVTLRYASLQEAVGQWPLPPEVEAAFSKMIAEGAASWETYRALAEEESTAARERYERAREQWLEEGANRLVDLHQRGWLQIRPFGGRPWLWAATEEGDLLPVLTPEQLQQALS